MEYDYSNMHLGTIAQPNICRDTTGGWLWYCDAHDTHGNADSEEEANIVSTAHAQFIRDNSIEWEDEDDPFPDCDIHIMRGKHHATN